MGKRDALTKTLATAGALLAWFPIAATIVVAIAGSVASRAFQFDCLMPAELFPAALAGGGLLYWAAWRARVRRGFIGWGLGAMLVLLFGGQALAIATGLASGEAEPAGWRWALVLSSLAACTLALVVVGAAGLLLVCDLFQQARNGGAPLPSN